MRLYALFEPTPAVLSDENAKLSTGDVSDGVIKLSLGKKRHVLLRLV